MGTLGAALDSELRASGFLHLDRLLFLCSMSSMSLHPLYQQLLAHLHSMHCTVGPTTHQPTTHHCV
jgi:hypothetical protein